MLQDSHPAREPNVLSSHKVLIFKLVKVRERAKLCKREKIYAGAAG
jgi:hypothetical protein